MKNKVYTEEEKQIVKDWAVKWLQFFDLINNVTGTDEPPHYPPPPMEEEEIAYQKLRSWFMANERTFIPIWNHFCEYRKQNCTEKASPDEIEALDDDQFVAFLRNPFSFYYRPGTLYLWGDHIGVQSGTAIWEPSEQAMQKVRLILGFLTKVLVEVMANWIGDR